MWQQDCVEQFLWVGGEEMERMGSGGGERKPQGETLRHHWPHFPRVGNWVLKLASVGESSLTYKRADLMHS